MSIDLYVSSPVPTSTRELAKLLRVECQISENTSVVKDGTVETGYHIKLIDFNSKEFKERIWRPLKKLLRIRCAFVKEEDQYMGCVLNWPSVFVKSCCAATPDDGFSLNALEEGVSSAEVSVTEPASSVGR